ncbi:MAG: TIGR03790 family protein [Cytophagales bacterium]|nr:TIGR03790 family protein [Armatimonadota bacterium]
MPVVDPLRPLRRGGRVQRVLKRRRVRWLLVLLFAGATLALFRPKPPAPGSLIATEGNQPLVSASQVLVVVNSRSADSREVAAYYVKKRGVPAANVVRVDCAETDEITRAEYNERLRPLVEKRARANSDLAYVVLTRGIPFRFSDFGTDGGFSVDSVLATCLLSAHPTEKALSPVVGLEGRFTRQQYEMLLVTRLDGPTVEDAKKLVDSSLASQPVCGPFYLRDSFSMGMADASAILAGRGFLMEWVRGFNNPKFPRYAGSGGPFMGHWGAGPHDTQYTEATYRAMRFFPGAICDLTWSFSAAGLRDWGSEGTICAMTRQGAAGVQGYVSEPYTDDISRPEIVLDRYTRGFTLAESFYAGTTYVHWKSLVLGDPICAPYAAR